LHSKDFSSLEQLLSAFEGAVKNEVRWFIDASQNGADPERARQVFVLDGILLSDSAAECRYPCDGRSKYHVLNLFCPGVATIGDSLMVLDKLVFRENRYSYREFMQILRDNYEGHEALLEEIKGYTMFGNDTDADAYTVMAANAILDAIETEEHHENHYLIPGFYSLERDVNWASQVDATPNGRKAGEHFSENQSPSYGADQCGITALLKSVSKLPFDRAVAGGLNLTFSRNMSPEVLRALVVSYFQLGGLHVGITVLDRKTLADAMIHPEKYQSLTVRLYGFSEYFVSLPKWQQLAILNRTEYA
jgi:formate C-acetyltransferase